MKTMAAVVEDFNKPLVVRRLTIPALRCGQVLVRVHCSGVCGAQLHHMSGVGTRKEFLPFLLGHEGGGEVVDVGGCVRSVKRGDRVVLHWRPGTGIESEFPKYTASDGSSVGGGLVTTFNDYAIVSENRVTKIGRDIPYDVAALMGCCLTTGLGLVNNEAQLKMGQSIVVFGCGGVGLSIIHGASMVSGNPIVAIDINDAKLEQATNCGASYTINTSNSNAKFAMKPFSEVDVCVDTTGKPECVEMAYDMTRPGGRTIMVGQPKHDQDFVFRNAFQHFKGKTLIDSEGGKTDPDIDIAKYLKLYRLGKINTEALISPDRFELKDVNRCMRMLKAGMILGRAMIWME